jgi:hypothetical protein
MALAVRNREAKPPPVSVLAGRYKDARLRGGS